MGNKKTKVKTRDDARSFFEKSGLTYKDLSKKNVQLLRGFIQGQMINSGLMYNSYRCKQRSVFQPDKREGRFWAGIRCKSFYFDDREAVSFNPDGFIGFAGWSDDKNIKPILKGFVEWVGIMKDTKNNGK